MSRFTPDALLEVFMQTKNATAVYTGENIVIEAATYTILALWNKDRSVIGKPMAEAIPELKGQPFINILKNVWITGNTYQDCAALTYLQSEGKMQPFYFDFEYRVIKNADGSTYCILHTATDVTQREIDRNAIEAKDRQLEETNAELIKSNAELSEIFKEQKKINDQLSESEMRFRMMAESSDVLISVNDAEGNVEYVNPAWMNLIGRSQEEMQADRWGDFLHPDDKQVLMQQYKEGIGSRAPFTIEFRMMNQCNEPRWIYTKVNPRLSEEGVYIGTIGSSIDVTERRMQQEEFQEINTRLNIAIDAGSFGSTEVDLATGNMICNDQFKRCFGRSPDENFTYPQMFEAMLPEYREEVRRRAVFARDNHSIYEAEYEIAWSDGSIHWISAHGRARYNNEGKAVKMVGILSDITESKRDEQRKSDFIGMVSHEMKTPLTSLKGYLQLLRMQTKSDDLFATNMLDRANNQIKKITTMINGFLNVSRLESGKMQMDKTRFDMSELVREAEEECRSLYNTHRIVFHPVETIVVNADREKIGQVINNLISNAVKYSPANTLITVSCAQVDGCATVSVRDSGIGIQESDKAKLFERYYRVNEGSKVASGFGIGLYLCAEIIHRHDGRIWVESEAGKGSTFAFSLLME